MMGNGSPLCAKLCERIVGQFKDKVSQCKIAKKKVFHHPHFIILWKDSGSKSQCVKAKGGHHCWMRVTIKPSGSIVWETVMLPWWTSPHGLGYTLENHCDSTQSAVASRNATRNCTMQTGRYLLILRRKSCLPQLWAKIPLAKLQQLISSVQ